MLNKLNEIFSKDNKPKEAQPAVFSVSVSNPPGAAKPKILVSVDLGDPLDEVVITNLLDVLSEITKGKFNQSINTLLVEKAKKRNVGSFVQNLVDLKVKSAVAAEEKKLPFVAKPLEELPPLIPPHALTSHHWHLSLKNQQ